MVVKTASRPLNHLSQNFYIPPEQLDVPIHKQTEWTVLSGYNQLFFEAFKQNTGDQRLENKKEVLALRKSVSQAQSQAKKLQLYNGKNLHFIISKRYDNGCRTQMRVFWMAEDVYTTRED